MTEPTPPRKQSRRRRRTPAGSPAAAPPAPVAPAGQAAGSGAHPDPSPSKDRTAQEHTTGRTRRVRGDSAAERGLRSLVSSRPTQLTPTAAMRAREVATPTPEDLAAAAEGLVLIRRNYVPPAPLTSGRRAGRGGNRRSRGGRSDQAPQDGSSGAAGSAS